MSTQILDKPKFSRFIFPESLRNFFLKYLICHHWIEGVEPPLQPHPVHAYTIHNKTKFLQVYFFRITMKLFLQVSYLCHQLIVACARFLFEGRRMSTGKKYLEVHFQLSDTPPTTPPCARLCLMKQSFSRFIFPESL